MRFFQLIVSVFVLYFVVVSNLSVMSHELESSNDHENTHLSPSQAGPAGKLYIKLKIHNKNNRNNINPIRQEGEEGDGRPVDNSRSGYKICDICGKEFSSGKAWGGHKRHHMKAMKESLNKDQVLKLKGPAESIEKDGVTERCNTIKAGDVKIREGKPVCCLCGKNFSSMNALFGHMKFHSDRNWKGTQPPLLANNNGSAFSYSVCESEAELDVVTFEELPSSLTGWRQTDKRGKEAKEIIGNEYSCDPAVYQAAMDLMKLSQDRRVITRPFQLLKPRNFKNLKTIQSDEDDNCFLRQEFAKKRKKKAPAAAKKKKYISMLNVENNDDELIRSGGFKCNGCGSTFSTFQALGGHRSSCTGKKSEESSQRCDDNQEENQPIPIGFGNLFQCDVCNKSFSTGQALGGHKRIHWKPTPLETQFVPTKKEHGYDDDDDDDEGCNDKLGFDLNEPYVLKDDE